MVLSNGHEYSDDSFIGQLTIQLFSEVGWQTLSALREVFGVGSMTGNETKGQRGLAELLTSFHCFTRDSLLPRLLSGQAVLGED